MHEDLPAGRRRARQPTQRAARTRIPGAEARARRDARRAAARGGATIRARRTAPIVPAGSVTGRSLTLVITIMCFLACLTAGAVYMMNQSASAWLRDIASEVTVQVEAKERHRHRQAGRRRERLPVAPAGHCRRARAQRGRLRPSCWSRGSGRSDVLKTLPVPRLIAIEIDRQAPPNMEALRAASARAVPGRHARRSPPLAAADPHRHALLRARRPRHPPARRRRHHRHHRLRDQERHGRPTARSSRCCISSAPRTASSPASSSAISCGSASARASSARSGRCSCSSACRR